MLVRRADKAACRSLGPLGPEDACNSQHAPNSLLNSMRYIRFWVYELTSLCFGATCTLTRLSSKSAHSAQSPACSTYPSKGWRQLITKDKNHTCDVCDTSRLCWTVCWIVTLPKQLETYLPVVSQPELGPFSCELGFLII